MRHIHRDLTRRTEPVFARALTATVDELRRQTTSPRLNLVLVIVGLVITVMGPFGTGEVLLFVPRAFYWLVVVFLTYYVAMTAGTFALTGTRGRIAWPIARGALVVAVQATAVLAIMTLIQLAVFGPGAFSDIETILVSIGITLAISILISAGFVVGEGLEKTGPQTAEQPSPRVPRIIARLDMARRGDLISLSVQDHYVEVVTTGGRDLVLIRLSDAIEETAPVPGMQIHRSHWVALDQVADLRRDGKKQHVVTRSGDQLPVSRTYLADLRAALES